MAISKNGLLLGRAAQTARRDLMNDIQESAEKQSEDCYRMCRVIANSMLDEDYRKWLDTTPDDNNGFYKAVKAKYAEVTADEGTAPSPIISGGEVLDSGSISQEIIF